MMNMKGSLAHLPVHQQQQLKEITKLITKAVDPEKIILFGGHTTGRWVEHQYDDGHIVYSYVSDFDILVIMKPGDTRKDYELQDIVETKCRAKTPVNAIIHDIGFINKMLIEGQYFFTDIEQEGILLYDAKTVAFARRKELSRHEAKKLAQGYFDHWFVSAKRLLEASALIRNSIDDALKESVYILRQAAERTYNAIILVFSGYQPRSHDLDKLYRYSKPYSDELEKIFPEYSPEDMCLFQLLCRAYPDASQADDLPINSADLEELFQRITQLQSIAEVICREKIAAF